MKTHRLVRAIGTAVLAGIFLVAAHSPTHAITIFTATLTGSQETPPNASPATGFGTFILNDAMISLEFHITFAGLLAPMTAAHFHEGAFGVAGPVRRGMTLADGFVPGVTAGSFNGFWTNVDSEPLTPALVAALLASNIYFNIHSILFPGGEIRGQLSQVPEPASLLLVGSGVAALGVAAWRQARRK